VDIPVIMPGYDPGEINAGAGALLQLTKIAVSVFS
jgi:hypothetical protein